MAPGGLPADMSKGDRVSSENINDYFLSFFTFRTNPEGSPNSPLPARKCPCPMHNIMTASAESESKRRSMLVEVDRFGQNLRWNGNFADSVFGLAPDTLSCQ